MGMFDNMNPDALALMAAGGAMATPPTRIPVPLSYSIAQGMAAIPQGLKQYQELQSGNLDLQRKQAFQPLVLQQIKNMQNGSQTPFSGVPGQGGQMSPADMQFNQAYNLAMASGDMGKASAVLQSWAEHNPQLAGAIEQQKQQNTFQKMPQGNYVMPSQNTQIAPPPDANASSMPANAPSAAPGAPASTNLATSIFSPHTLAPAVAPRPGDDTPAPGMPPINPALAAAPNGQIAPQQSPMAKDGKPILPTVTGNLFQPDASGTPKYNTPNTETGVNQTKLFQTSDDKANTAFSSNASSLQNEQFRLKELTDVYKQVQSGTLTAQNPELANKLIAWGVIKNPAEIKDVAGVQNALQSHALQIIQQIKDTNANLGGAPTRTFGSEISNLQEQGENPGAQPEALWNIIGQARGLVDHNLDMVKGWDAIGGLGNRAANGYTLRPDDYARKFIENHDISDYKKAAQADMGPFKGMPGATPTMLKTPGGISYSVVQ